MVSYLYFSDSSTLDGKCVGNSGATGVFGAGLADKSVTNIEIPSKVGTTKVVEIGYNSFRGTGIVSIVIPRTVKLIKRYAFFQCLKLSKVLFEERSGLEEWFANPFYDCALLKMINLPPSLKTIEYYGSNNLFFHNMANLECVSYLGETDFSSNEIFKDSKIPEIHVSSKYPKTAFGGQTVIKDNKVCVPFVSNKSKRENRFIKKMISAFL